MSADPPYVHAPPRIPLQKRIARAIFYFLLAMLSMFILHTRFAIGLFADTWSNSRRLPN